MDRALAKDDLEAWAAADEAFHLHLLKLCGNARIEQIVRKYWDQIHRVRYITLKLGPKPVASAREHREIVDTSPAAIPAPRNACFVSIARAACRSSWIRSGTFGWIRCERFSFMPCKLLFQ